MEWTHLNLRKNKYKNVSINSNLNDKLSKTNNERPNIKLVKKCKTKSFKERFNKPLKNSKHKESRKRVKIMLTGQI